MSYIGISFCKMKLVALYISLLSFCNPYIRVDWLNDHKFIKLHANYMKLQKHWWKNKLNFIFWHNISGIHRKCFIIIWMRGLMFILGDSDTIPFHHYFKYFMHMIFTCDVNPPQHINFECRLYFLLSSSYDSLIISPAFFLRF